jgi:hypothetical protein
MALQPHQPMRICCTSELEEVVVVVARGVAQLWIVRPQRNSEELYAHL